jgi:xylan 1,4-beta-xylosidase
LASGEANKVAILAWHYHDEDISGQDAAITMELKNLPFATGNARLEHYRIDEEHSNAFSAWKRMGSPQQPTSEQYKSLERTGYLATLGPTENLRVDHGAMLLKFVLPRQAVDLIIIDWGAVPR